MKQITWAYLLITLLLVSSCATQKTQRPMNKGPIEANFEKQIVQGTQDGSYLSSKSYFIASDALLREDYELASKHFKELVSKEPKDMFLKRKLAITLIKNSKLEESLAHLEAIFTHSKFKDSQIGLVLAGVYTGVSKRKRAQSTYKKILKVDSKHVDACIFLGKSYALEGNFIKGKSLLRKCSKQSKDNGIFDYYIGKMYVNKENYKKAMIYFKKALKKDPSYAQAALGIGLIQEESKKNSHAINTYKKFLKKDKNNLIILNRVVALLFALKKYEELVPYAEALSDVDPSNLNLRVKLGILYTDTKRYAKAISIFKGLIAGSPSNDKLIYYLGAIYQETEQYQNAIEYFTMINTESGLYQDSSVQIAQMLGKLAYTDKNIESEFVKFVSDRSKTLKHLAVEFSIIQANYFEKVSNIPAAIDTLAAVKSNEQFKESHSFYLASLYEKGSLFDEAYDEMFGLLEKNPDNAHALNFVGYSYVERGVKLDDAFKYLSRASALRPKDGYIKDSLGWYYYRVGNMEMALTVITSAAELVKNDASIQKHLAIIHAKLKNFRLAKKYLKNAIKYSSNTSTIEKLKGEIKLLETNRLPASFK